MNLSATKLLTVLSRSKKRDAVHSIKTMHTLAMLVAIAAPYVASTATAFEDLNEPQTLIYDTSHLVQTNAGTTIAYDYAYIDNTTDIKIEDQVFLSIKKEHENAHRDVSLSFLTAERKLHLPDFNKRRGNPVIIGMLEHLAQAMGTETGGGALYFRNRIKDKLADENLEVIQTGDKSEFSFSPFVNDPYVADRVALTESVITIAFSNEVPGQLLSIEYVSGPSNNPEATRKLEFSGVNQE
ncbi:MAG: hypothetical protein V3U65_07810 [Granulosicoccaceae bacterium]